MTRSETVTMRLTPKLRYLAELAARKHRRTLSSYIEWVLAQRALDAGPVPEPITTEWCIDHPEAAARMINVMAQRMDEAGITLAEKAEVTTAMGERQA